MKTVGITPDLMSIMIPIVPTQSCMAVHHACRLDRADGCLSTQATTDSLITIYSFREGLNDLIWETNVR